MARTCTVCAHPNRETVDRALVEGVSFPTLVAEYRVSKDALSRHRANHLPATLAKSQDAQEVAEADDLLAQVQNLQSRTLSILEAAESTSQHRTALSAIREARSNLELLAKLVGELDDSPTVNIALSAEWIQIRTVLLEVLTPYPQARAAVAVELLNLGILENPGEAKSA